MKKCYVVSLVRAEDRRLTFRNDNKWLSFEFFDAIDAYNNHIPFIEKISSSFNKNDFSLGALGCLLSHRVLWKKLVHSSESYMIILEDDVVLEQKKYEYWIDRVLKQEIDNFDIYFLGATDGKSIPNLAKVKHFSFLNGFVSNVFENSLYCAYGYIISNDGAKKLLKKTHIDLPVDYWGKFNENNDLKYLCVYPNIAKPNELANISSVQEIKNFKQELLLMVIARVVKANIMYFLRNLKIIYKRYLCSQN